jgi:TolA-binding protein
MRIGLSILALLLCSVSALAVHSDRAAEEPKKHHHNHAAVVDVTNRTSVLQRDLTRDEATIEKDEARIEKLESNIGSLNLAQLKELQTTVDKHNTYFGILTALTGITAAAVLSELVRRWMGAKSSPSGS